jgi:hypothetical protein
MAEQVRIKLLDGPAWRLNLPFLADREVVPKATHLQQCQDSRSVSRFYHVLQHAEFILNFFRARFPTVLYSTQTGGRKVGTKEKRWYKDIGLGFKTPTEAINGTYIGLLTKNLATSQDADEFGSLQTRSAPSPERSRFAVVSSLARSSPPR